MLNTSEIWLFQQHKIWINLKVKHRKPNHMDETTLDRYLQYRQIQLRMSLTCSEESNKPLMNRLLSTNKHIRSQRLIEEQEAWSRYTHKINHWISRQKVSSRIEISRKHNCIVHLIYQGSWTFQSLKPYFDQNKIVRRLTKHLYLLRIRL